jgi:hypothetical protein
VAFLTTDQPEHQDHSRLKTWMPGICAPKLWRNFRRLECGPAVGQARADLQVASFRDACTPSLIPGAAFSPAPCSRLINDLLQVPPHCRRRPPGAVARGSGRCDRLALPRAGSCGGRARRGEARGTRDARDGRDATERLFCQLLRDPRAGVGPGGARPCGSPRAPWWLLRYPWCSSSPPRWTLWATSWSSSRC